MQFPETTFDDIVWVKPKKKKRKEPIIETHTSSSADIEYTTKYYPDSGNYYCTCPGTWRAKDRRCKHIKALEEKIKNKYEKINCYVNDYTLYWFKSNTTKSL